MKQISIQVFATTAIVLASLSGCASTSITQLSRNQAMIDTTAAPVCHTTGASSVAQQMAAITTIKQGFSRFVVLGYGTQDNTRLVTTGPTYATTNATVNTFGNTTYGTATTTFGGEQTFVAGRNNAQFRIVMLNPGDEGYDQGLDAKQTLGPDWEKKVDQGINNCF